MTLPSPIALYDSGLGGLSVLRVLTARLPGETFLYFGDTARVPYGPRPAAEIVAFNLQIADWLVAEGAKCLVVACNTSSALALTRLENEVSVPIVGLIQAGAEAVVDAAPDGPIGLIATQATVASGAYQRAIAARAPSAPVLAQACPALVPLVESGAWAGPEAHEALRDCLAPFLATPPRALLLGCTHYPHLAPLIASWLPGVPLIDPAIRLADHVESVLSTRGIGACRPAVPPLRVTVSGDAQRFRAEAERLIPGLVSEVERVTLPTLAAGRP